jgi:hypothetical protein
MSALRIGALCITGAVALLAAAPGAGGADAAAATTFHVVNQRGIAQPLVSVIGDRTGTTDYAGNVTLDLSPGEFVYFSRYRGPPCGGAPEGALGQEYVVPDPAPPTAEITLPNTTGDSFLPENNDNERWIVGKVNELREANGKPPMAISTILNQAASAMAHDWVTVHHQFPNPFCFLIPRDWGFPDQFGNALLDGPFTYPQSAFAHWMELPVTVDRALLGDYDTIGVGEAIVGGEGMYNAILAKCPLFMGAPAVQCGRTTDQGDPTLPIPAPPSGGGGGDGGGGAGGGGTGGGATTGGGTTGGAATGGGGTGGAGAGGGGGGAGGKALPTLGELTVPAVQRGTTVSGFVFVGYSGSQILTELLSRKAQFARAKLVLAGRGLQSGVARGKRRFYAKLNAKAKRALKKHGKLRLTMRVTITPPGGSPVTVSRKVTVRKK